MNHPASSLTRPELAFLDTVRAFGGEAAGSALWDAFAPAWGALLRAAWEAASRSPEEALEELRRDHRAQAGLDPGGIHPSWWVRALREEPDSVRRAVIAHAAAGVKPALQAAFELDDNDLATDRPASPPVLEAALGLWTERLVGDVPPREEDPPVVVAMTRLDPGRLSRLVHLAGLVKWALANEAPPSLRSRDRERLTDFRSRVRESHSPLRGWAAEDIRNQGRPDVAGTPPLGLLTLGRLLEAVEPHRARWALQHVPYAVARSIRVRAKANTFPVEAQVAAEAEVLSWAWNRLRIEDQRSSEGSVVDDSRP